jgi:hypothetical protein
MTTELMEHYRDLAARGGSSPARIEGQIAAASFKARLGATSASERADLYQFCADMARHLAERSDDKIL